MGFADLARLLGVDEKTAWQAWNDAPLDADERFSLGFRLGLPFDADIGQAGETEYQRGLGKLKDALKKTSPPKKKAK